MWDMLKYIVLIVLGGLIIIILLELLIELIYVLTHKKQVVEHVEAIDGHTRTVVLIYPASYNTKTGWAPSFLSSHEMIQFKFPDGSIKQLQADKRKTESISKNKSGTLTYRGNKVINFKID